MIASMLQKSILIIGIAGGSGSGKTNLVNKLAEEFKGKVTILTQDSYYKDLSHLSLEERTHTNFDIPEAIEWTLFIEHINVLKNGNTIHNQPIYDFTEHKRKKKVKKLQPNKIILIEGILLYTHPIVRNLCDIKIFLDVPAEYRFVRRKKRDIEERGRTLDDFYTQYFQTVLPMYKQHVAPSKQYADIIIPGASSNQIAQKLIITYLYTYLEQIKST